MNSDYVGTSDDKSEIIILSPTPRWSCYDHTELLHCQDQLPACRITTGLVVSPIAMPGAFYHQAFFVTISQNVSLCFVSSWHYYVKCLQQDAHWAITGWTKDLVMPDHWNLVLYMSMILSFDVIQ
jgi:hypothetical protein